jgi:adsorption protein B
MVPAWDESSVIRSMLENTQQTINYSNYHIFVGTYPNDADTQREVELAREQFENVHRVVCPKDGPTNKADNLNWIFQGIKTFEKENNVQFAIFVIHDSEDILHPLSLRLFNYLIPRKDMIQLPVLPLETKWYHFTAGHYIDEFSENHYKNMEVREALNRWVPCAGVGCASSRHAFDLIAGQNNNLLFSIDSLTEDYDFAFRLQQLGLKEIFVKQAIERITTKHALLTRRNREVTKKEYIATREFFPAKLWSAVRQKSRWVVGINLQGWANLGWSGNLTTKYMLYRDRKSLITNMVNVLGYVVVFSVLAIWLSAWFYPDAYHYPPLIEVGSWVWYIILGDAFFMLWRIFQRTFIVQRIYNWQQALLSIPRLVWSNIINFLATGRAIYQYIQYLLTGNLIPWDKTHHVFPSEAELATYRRRLGDLLLEKRFITVEQLDEALSQQKKVNRPLGDILLKMGFVEADDLIQALGVQFQLTTTEIDPYGVPRGLLYVLPQSLAVKYSVFPLEMENNQLAVATDNIIRREQVEELEQELGLPIKISLTTRGDLAFAIRRGYERLEKASKEDHQEYRIGGLLLKQNLITNEQLQKALKAQRQTYVRLGDILTEEAIISSERLKEAINRYSSQTEGWFGDFLVQNYYISREQLEKVLNLQETRIQPLGEIMVQLGMISNDRLKQILDGEPNET